MKSLTLTPRRIALLALLSALAVVGRLLLIGVPNVQPVTVLLLIITLEMGWGDGLIVATISMVASNLLLGSMGPWTLYQVASFALVVTLFRLTKPLYLQLASHKLARLVVFSLIAGLMGYVYGFVISLFSVWLFRMPNFWVYYLQGLAFDSLHAIGNVGFWWLLAPILLRVLKK